MIEYKVLMLNGKKPEDIEVQIMDYAMHRWRVVCSFGKHGNGLIIKRKAREEIKKDG